MHHTRPSKASVMGSDLVPGPRSPAPGGPAPWARAQAAGLFVHRDTEPQGGPRLYELVGFRTPMAMDIMPLIAANDNRHAVLAEMDSLARLLGRVIALHGMAVVLMGATVMSFYPLL